MERRYDKIMTKVTYVIAAIVVLLVVYFVFAKPYFTFQSYEKKMLAAAQRYYEINSSKLPTGKRVDTVGLSKLYNEKYIDQDFTVPLSSKLCNIKDSWVKVRMEESDYQYYVYLDCGYMESKVDHEGPVIKLNGDKEMTITKKEKFTDPGISSVIDKNDGKMNVGDVKVSGEVDTSVTGIYKIKYSIMDSLTNKTEVTRVVNVIDTVASITKRESQKGYYSGNASNNHIAFANHLYRIIGLDGDNVKIVSDEVVTLSNYDAINKQLEKYYDTLPSKTKKLIVKNKYCKDQLSTKNTDTTECSSYTEERNMYIPSLADINKVKAGTDNYLISQNLIWTANTVKEDYSYMVGESMMYLKGNIIAMNNSYNAGIKPVVTIKGDLIVEDGDGSLDNPYIIQKDFKSSKPGEEVNKRLPGEYISLESGTWEIIETLDDGTTKIILDGVIETEEDLLTFANPRTSNYEYDPKKVGSYAYNINNKANTYLPFDKLVSHEIEIPVYDGKILYGKEKKPIKSKVKLSAVNIYDLYTVGNGGFEYLPINASKDKNEFYIINEEGNLQRQKYLPDRGYAVRPVAFLKQGAKVVEGTGRIDEPYTIK